MCDTIWPMFQAASPLPAAGRHSAAAGGSAATSRAVRRRTLSKKRRYESMSVIIGGSFVRGSARLVRR